MPSLNVRSWEGGQPNQYRAFAPSAGAELLIKCTWCPPDAPVPASARTYVTSLPPDTRGLVFSFSHLEGLRASLLQAARAPHPRERWGTVLAAGEDGKQPRAPPQPLTGSK